ncbi:hypothetical protein IGI41_000610 [Enterococcus sp. DIV0876]
MKRLRKQNQEPAHGKNSAEKTVVPDTNQLNAEEEAEFNIFFQAVLEKLPKPAAKIIRNSYGRSRAQAEKIMAKGKEQSDRVFDSFLLGVDDATRKKAHRIIHAASLTAAIIGCSPIPFSDAFLLVPVQMTMMARLYRLFGRPWSEGLTKSLSKEMVVVTFGRSAVGNVLKFVPAVGTVAGAAVNATVATGITEALGWVTVKMLNDGEDIFDQVMSFKGQFYTLIHALNIGKISK